jgi:hypothetical protein
MDELTITIPIARFEQLVRSEQDARFLKSYIKSKKDNFRSIDHDEVVMLCEIYIGGDSE